MALNFYSKHGIIIGTFTMIASLFLSLSEIARIGNIFDPDDYSSSLPIAYKVRSVATLILVMLTGVLSPFLIFGIVKKRHLLMAPWLVVSFLLSALISFNEIYGTVTRTYFRLSNYIPIVILIGLSIILLYPICHLFTEIRIDNVTASNPKESKSNYALNIQQSSVDKVSEKSII